MKAIVINGHGGVDKLRYQDFPEPICREGEALVRVKACAVNRLDIWVRRGLPNRSVSFPHILGSDISGQIVYSIGGLNSGDDVIVYPGISCNKCRYCMQGKENLCDRFSIIGGFGDWHGGYAEYVKVPMHNLISMPRWLNYEEACTLGVAYLTSYSMLSKAIRSLDHEGIDGNDRTLLVYSAGSGVGVASIQFAKALGMKVITTSSKGKLDKAKSIADYVIDREEYDIIKEVMSITDGKGASIVIDQLGIWDTSIKAVMKGGVIMVCGATLNEYAQVEVRALYNRSASINGAYLGTKKEMIDMLELMHEHNIKPIIDGVFALEDAMLAHARMEMNHHFGKIVLRP
jgi:NADPH:quinone reductase-like Zn-dependent oxidoreductase